MSVESGVSHGVNVSEIMERNSQRFGVTTEQLLQKNGSPEVNRARNRLHREMHDAGMTYTAIGEETGGRHYSTIINNVRKDVASTDDFIAISKEKIDSEIEQYLEENFPGVSLEDIFRKSKSNAIVIPRQALARHLFYDTGLYIEQIGRLLQRDHSTIIHAVNKPEEEMDIKIETWKKSSKKEGKRAERARLKLKEKQELEEEKRRKSLIKLEESERLEDEKRRKSEMPAIIFAVIADTYMLDEERLIGSSRKKEITWPRHLIAYFIRQYTDLYFSKIGEMLSRDYTTILNSVMRVEEKMEMDEPTLEEVETLGEEILDFAAASNQKVDNFNNELTTTKISSLV